MPEPEKKSHAWIVAAALAALAYFFVAARPLGKELTFKPAWSVPLASAAQGAPSDARSGSAMPFELSGSYGYFSREGRILFSAKAADRVALSSFAFAEFGGSAGSRGDQLAFKGIDGKPAFTVRDPGFPAFVADRLFLASGDGLGLSAYSSNGERRWSRDMSSVITCFDANGTDAVAGGLDGRLEVIGPDGSLAFDYSPGGSRLPVISGCAISADSSMVALVSGVDRQRFILLGRRDDGYRVLYHAYLKSDFRRRVFVRFSEDGRYVLYEKEGGLAVLDARTRRTSSIAVSGEVKEVRQSASGEFFLILSGPSGAAGGGAASTARLKVVRAPDTEVMEASFAASGYVLDRSGESLFLGGDGRIARIEMGMI